MSDSSTAKVIFDPYVSPEDFDFVRSIVSEDSALSLNDSKEYLVQARLMPVAESQGFDSIGELLNELRGGSRHLRRCVVEALATHETHFFRDLYPFEALRDEAIPQVLAANGGKSLSVWSAATSTGQEAYSVAMLVNEEFADVANVTILGSDISQEVIAKSEAAIYSQLEVNRGLPAAMLVKYFIHMGRAWRIDEELRRRVTFRVMNLDATFVNLPAMDIVLLRNVLIYFDPDARVRLIKRVAEVMNPGGYLFLGGAESTIGLGNAFDRIDNGKTVYFRLKPGDETVK